MFLRTETGNCQCWSGLFSSLHPGFTAAILPVWLGKTSLSLVGACLTCRFQGHLPPGPPPPHTRPDLMNEWGLVTQSLWGWESHRPSWAHTGRCTLGKGAWGSLKTSRRGSDPRLGSSAVSNRCLGTPQRPVTGSRPSGHLAWFFSRRECKTHNGME